MASDRTDPPGATQAPGFLFGLPLSRRDTEPSRPTEVKAGQVWDGAPEYQDTQDLVNVALAGSVGVVAVDGETAWVKTPQGVGNCRPGAVVSSTRLSAATKRERLFLAPMTRGFPEGSAPFSPTDLTYSEGGLKSGSRIDTYAVEAFRPDWLRGYWGQVRRDDTSLKQWRAILKLIHSQFEDSPRSSTQRLDYRQGAVVNAWLSPKAVVPCLIISGDKMNQTPKYGAKSQMHRHYILETVDYSSKDNLFHPDYLYVLSPELTGLSKARTLDYTSLRAVSRSRFRGQQPLTTLEPQIMAEILREFRKLLAGA